MKSPQLDAPKRTWWSPRSFRTKFIMVVGAAVVFDLLLSGSVALWNVTRLGHDASDEIRRGLSDASDEHLESYLEATALRADALLGQMRAELTTLADSMQAVIDQPDAARPAASPRPEFRYDPTGGWAQNPPGASVISVWGYLLDAQHQPTPEAQRQVDLSASFDVTAKSLLANGAKELQMYYIGPKDAPIMRTVPYTDQAQTFDKLYPGHNAKNFWDFFFPGAYEGWQAWARDRKSAPNDGFVTGTMPYIDAITGKLIVSYFHPLWSRDRTDCVGAVALDMTLDQLSALSTNVHLEETGFGFYTKRGNILAITDAGLKTLGIETKDNAGAPGVTALDRKLSRSINPQIAKLRPPGDDRVHKLHLTLEKNGQPEKYFVGLRRLAGVNLWDDGKTYRDYPMLGFVVPEREIYASLYSAEAKIAQAASRIRDGQILILFLSLGVVLVAVVSISRRITSGITALSGAAKRIEANDFTTRVNVPTNDEVGELAHAFNAMSQQIETYTTTLEYKVEERTQKLAVANREIQALNERLESENVRMGAELDVARRLQTMVLPKPEELRSVPRLDIAAYMEPASEVGGDYYDVLQCGSRVKIGIGDVTGHGLESGVLMLMVQSVARALLENGEHDPKRFLTVLNQVLVKNIGRAESDNNLTLAFLDYDEHRGNVTLSGQHEEVILIRREGAVERIDTMDLGFPVGLEDDIGAFVATHELQLEAGDVLVLYTDGITEADNSDGRFFGIDALCASAAAARAGSANEIRQRIVEDVTAHIGSQPLRDDLTLVVIKHG